MLKFTVTQISPRRFTVTQTDSIYASGIIAEDGLFFISEDNNYLKQE